MAAKEAGQRLLRPYVEHLRSALGERFGAETVASGLATAAAGAAAAAAVSAAWWCTAATLDAARRECSSDFVVTSRSQVFQWLKVWLAAQPEFARSSQCATVQLEEELDPGVVVKAGTQGGLGFSAAEQSTHWFRHDGTLASLALRRERVPGRQDVESLLLTLHGWPGRGAAEGRRAKLVALVEAARSLYTGQTQGRTEMFIGQAEYSGWESIGTRRSRTVASVVLPAGVADGECSFNLLPPSFESPP